MKRIVFENPAPSKRGRSGGTVQAFINRLSETPDKWAVYTRSANHISYYYTVASKMDNLKIAVRANSDGNTHTVYMMILGAEATKTRVAEKANKKANKKVAVKKATAKKVTVKK
jgi:hypothetical protein